MKSNTKQSDAQALLDSFQEAQQSLVMLDGLKHEATQLEHTLNSTLKADHQFPSLEEAAKMNIDSHDQLAKLSLGAHVRKLQSHQAAQSTNTDLLARQAEVERKYVGRKIIATGLSNAKPVTALWLKPNSSEIVIGKVRRTGIKGRIKEVSLRNNVIIVNPSFFEKLLQPNRLAHAIEVIDFTSMQPQVSIVVK